MSESTSLANHAAAADFGDDTEVALRICDPEWLGDVFTPRRPAEHLFHRPAVDDNRALLSVNSDPGDRRLAPTSAVIVVLLLLQLGLLRLLNLPGVDLGLMGV